ncbi:MAG: hypothetical protein QXI24_04050 [Acidilobaceae archaeon]
MCGFTLFDIRWSIPAAILLIAMRISRENNIGIEDALRIIAEYSEGWVRGAASMLIYDSSRRRRLLEDIESGFRPPDSIILEVERRIRVK